ncbi:hypothetical protein [Methylovirgula sp. 4M-Z18]|uniref:hypothetical protein n=1 Tax=Methylovirgula sp. 4M-Z18 TaxID=2293567 RepID=UPI000E2E578F|nr:hypothetical protein [Methylovirgula sp. 4M-Z18]RFB76617.1 hypothetical protein DYH55_19310 [Methylovirgula sp. 4M-Z18]
MTLEITVPGATDEEIARGIAAAWKVFYDAGISPQDAVAGVFAVEGDEFALFSNGAFGELAEDVDFDRADTWWAACDAALTACCMGWPDDRRPSSAHLEIKEEREAAERRKSARGAYVTMWGQPLIDRNGGTI